MQNGCEGLSSIILASQGLLVKMLVTIEPHGIVLNQIFHTNTF